MEEEERLSQVMASKWCYAMVHIYVHNTMLVPPLVYQVSRITLRIKLRVILDVSLLFPAFTRSDFITAFFMSRNTQNRQNRR